jgi:hypothetical protein
MNELVFENIDYNKLTEFKYEWQKLSYKRCSVCSLSDKKYKLCPTAFEITEIIEVFSDVYSYERVSVDLYFDEFDMSYSADAQTVCADLLTHIIVRSGCPVFSKYQLFTKNYYMFREIGDIFMQFIVAFAIHRLALTGDFPTKDEIVDELSIIKEVVTKLKERIVSCAIKDANLNALVKFMQIHLIIEDNLDEYLNELRDKFL